MTPFTVPPTVDSTIKSSVLTLTTSSEKVTLNVGLAIDVMFAIVGDCLTIDCIVKTLITSCAVLSTAFPVLVPSEGVTSKIVNLLASAFVSVYVVVVAPEMATLLVPVASSALNHLKDVPLSGSP